MNKKVMIGICISVLVVIIGVFAWIKLNNTFDKSNPIIFEKGSNGDYSYIIYQGREYVPYCAVSQAEREKYLGYVGEDKQDEIYTFKGHLEEEWLISYLDSGMMNDCMLLKEKSVTNIPEGLTSEYEWNKNEIREEQNDSVENIKIKVNNEILNVKLEQNSSSEALVERLKRGDITIYADDYGNFEKVGDLGFNLPTNDTKITTKPGDLILYQGNQITLYYDTNTWNFTKLGEIIGKSKNELKDILGSGNVTLVLSID